MICERVRSFVYKRFYVAAFTHRIVVYNYLVTFPVVVAHWRPAAKMLSPLRLHLSHSFAIDVMHGHVLGHRQYTAIEKLLSPRLSRWLKSFRAFVRMPQCSA